TPAEVMREHQRALTKAQRELDRERTKLEQQEKKLIADIKKTAKANQMVVFFVSLTNGVSRQYFWNPECVQNHGEG
ncbi:hypothetical protein BDK51DRAFT_14305, partial [Blyttiomyces helicus]